MNYTTVILAFMIFVGPISANSNVANSVQYTLFNVSESILCRSCGHDIATTKFIIAKTSPYSQYSFYDTVFNQQHQVLVQMFTELVLFHFPIVTLSKSACSGVGEWDRSSWFPAYDSRSCGCPECGALLGWEYQLSDHTTLGDIEAFSGFILPNIIGESFADSLVQQPKIHD